MNANSAAISHAPYFQRRISLRRRVSARRSDLVARDMVSSPRFVLLQVTMSDIYCMRHLRDVTGRSAALNRRSNRRLCDHRSRLRVHPGMTHGASRFGIALLVTPSVQFICQIACRFPCGEPANCPARLCAGKLHVPMCGISRYDHVRPRWVIVAVDYSPLHGLPNLPVHT